MIDLPLLASIEALNRQALQRPVAPLRIGDRELDTDRRAAIQAVVNLSPDSTYRTSIAPDTESALRRSRIAAAAGADFVDLGAESTSQGAGVVDAQRQLDALAPVVRELHGEGIATSVESYHPVVLERLVALGAEVINLTGSADDDAVFAIAAESGAALILCFVPEPTVRHGAELPQGAGAVQHVVDHLRPRLERALAAGVTSIAVDPGIGFSYANLSSPAARVAAQSRYLLLGGALRQLGYPVLQSLPHAFPVFQEHYRSGEAFYAVLALLGGAGVLRVHEVGEVRAVREALAIDVAL